MQHHTHGTTFQHTAYTISLCLFFRFGPVALQLLDSVYYIVFFFGSEMGPKTGFFCLGFGLRRGWLVLWDTLGFCLVFCFSFFGDLLSGLFVSFVWDGGSS